MKLGKLNQVPLSFQTSVSERGTYGQCRHPGMSLPALKSPYVLFLYLPLGLFINSLALKKRLAYLICSFEKREGRQVQNL